ncbi:hypothetical protein HHK36_027235 [Tetracentron sinense]|uniref:RING-type E3 ubiquitin transferase n=1 Tax=Tetracentron sinense TaxID=13715 RepID=A0A834YL12_TETSI|nr:hypothetical protein HHK36_027235 [Tetracentron sinense]
MRAILWQSQIQSTLLFKRVLAPVSYNVISYTISFTLPPDFKLGGGSISTNMSSTVEIFAEGIYDVGTGGLCMVGCRDLGSNHQKSTKNDSMDCEILVDVQFPPLNAKSGGYVKGTIKSTQEKTDSLYFKHLELSSSAIYTFCLLQLTWSTRLGAGSQKGLWVAEKKALHVCLPLYLGDPIQLILEFERQGSCLFIYVGTTAVCLLPHAYDFYSTGWDVIIPCGGLLFAALIYLQQRFGGHCILPQRFRGSGAYEKVPVVSGE